MENLKPLLEFQELDSKLFLQKQQLASLPKELSWIESKKQAFTKAFEEKRSEGLQMKAKHLGLEKDLKEKEGLVIKYKTQQLSIKKNEEFQALQTMINQVLEEKEALEYEILSLLMDLDQKKAELALAEQCYKEDLEALAKEQGLLESRKKVFEQQILEMEALCKDKEKEVDGAWLRVYNIVKQSDRKPPFVVPLVDHRCGGCYLKVSHEKVKNVYLGEQIAQCDGCGRILYRDI